jgi:hypothetical protein
MNSIKNLKNVLFHCGSVPWPTWWDRKACYAKEYSERLKYQEPGRGNIFFGPCKKEMRWEIRELMKNHPTANVYVVGLSNSTFQPRAIVYYMEIEGKPMTFRDAYNRFHNQFPDIIGTGIHIKPTSDELPYTFNYYGKVEIKLPYEHLGVVCSCKKAPHPKDEWIKDIARDYDQKVKKCGPDCCFIGSKDSVFFGKTKTYFKVDEKFCDLLKKGKLCRGDLDEKHIGVNNPIPNARGNHLRLEGKNASKMVKTLKEIYDPSILELW